MRYLITNGQVYLSSIKGVPFTFEVEHAIRFKNQKKAQTQIHTSFPRGIERSQFYIIEDTACIEENHGGVRVTNGIDASAVSANVDEILRITVTLKAEHARLINQQSKAEAEIQDIMHAAEFYNLNASQGYKLYKMLHEARIKRREAKDGVEIISTLLDSKVSSCEDVKSKLDSLSDRSYKPRVLNKLFGI